MRLVVWNANMAVHRKLDALAALRPDIAVIPECADPAVLGSKASTAVPQMVWIGNNPNKGLAVFAFGGYSVRLFDEFDPRLEWIAPVRVEGRLPFTLLAAWCKNHRASQQHPLTSHRRQVEPALKQYRELLDDRSAVVAGDLNSNVCWDVGKWGSNFSNVVQAAGALDLVSAYHQTRSIEFGAEPDPTLYWQTRTRDGRSYHIDYCFLPRTWLPYVTVGVGEFDAWVGSGLSDHVPLVVDIDHRQLLASIG
jgi:exodeoxyribonuclease-3